MEGSPAARAVDSGSDNKIGHLLAWKAICWHMKVMHDAVSYPPPVSVLNACRPLHRSHWANGAQASSILLVVHSGLVPELSKSRYLWTSNMRFVVLPSRFTTFLSASAEPLETNVAADVQLFPGSRIICVVALRQGVRTSEKGPCQNTYPAVRMAVTAACTDAAQRLIS